MTLVAGPTTLEDPKDIEVIHVQSAEEMFEQVTSRFDEQDIVVEKQQPYLTIHRLMY